MVCQRIVTWGLVSSPAQLTHKLHRSKIKLGNHHNCNPSQFLVFLEIGPTLAWYNMWSWNSPETRLSNGILGPFLIPRSCGYYAVYDFTADEVPSFSRIFAKIVIKSFSSRGLEKLAELCSWSAGSDMRSGPDDSQSGRPISVFSWNRGLQQRAKQLWRLCLSISLHLSANLLLFPFLRNFLLTFFPSLHHINQRHFWPGV